MENLNDRMHMIGWKAKHSITDSCVKYSEVSRYIEMNFGMHEAREKKIVGKNLIKLELKELQRKKKGRSKNNLMVTCREKRCHCIEINFFIRN